MAMTEIISLVQLGFAGFAAAMAVLSYRLIRLQASQPNPNIRVITSLQAFTKYTLYLSLVVLASKAVDSSFDLLVRRLASEDADKARHALVSSQQAQSCRESLSGLVGAESTGRSPKRVAEVARLTYTACFSAMQALESMK